MSGMTLGGMIEADRRIREYEFMMRRVKKQKADEDVWKKWEGLVEEERETHGRRGREGNG